MNNNANERNFNEVLERALTFKKQRSKKNRRHRVVRVLAAIVAFATTYTLIIPAITMESESMQVLICEKESHMHGESCYTTETTLTCGLEESEPHVHSDACYETVEMSTLTCGISGEEHTHDAGCYTTETELVLACGENGGGHTHSDACYTTERVLTCEKEEHAHTSECFELREPGTVTDENVENVENSDSENGEDIENTETAENGGENIENTDNTENEANGTAGSETNGENLGGEIADGDNNGENDIENTENVENENTEPVEVIVEDTEVNIDEYVPYVTDEALIDFHIVGTINIDAVKENADLEAAAVDAAENPELGGEAAQNEQETVENIDNTVNETETAENVETVDNTAAETDIDTAEANGENAEPENESEPIAENENSGFNIEIIDNLIDSDDEEVLLERELTVAASYNGIALDLSECEITAEITPSEFMVEYVESGVQTYAVSEEETAEWTEMGVEITVSDESGNEDTMLLLADTEFEPITLNLLGAKMTMRSIITPNPTFKVQYYANIERVVRSATKGSNSLALIDTDGGSTPQQSGKGGKLPDNRLSQPETFIHIENNKVKTAKQETQIYETHEFAYYSAPGLNYFDIVTTNADNYTVSSIAVLKPNGNENQKSDWCYIDYIKGYIHFTNRLPEGKEADSFNIYKEGEHVYVLVKQNSLLRLIYEADSTTHTNDVNFYDYDITDGKIYRSESDAENRVPGKGEDTKNQDVNKNTVYYASTNQQGINNPGNYTGTGVKIAFGNGNAGSGLGYSTWNKEDKKTDNGEYPYINKANTQWNSSTSSSIKFTYMGGAYGLVTGMNAKGTDVVFADGIQAQKLFGAARDDGKEVIGKTSIDGKLKFERVGDSYTLSSATINNTDGTSGELSGLDKFTGSTNNFWPMDYADTYGATGHDLKFGDKSILSKRKFVGWRNDSNTKHTGDFTESDDGKDHNSYFGMNFSVGFKLTEDYIGPLEYFFFGDDDMWVFLSEYDEKTKTYSNSQLICDIGGVHSATGEYVNLWDYIDRTKLGQKDENGDEIAKSYALTFFYTERGASGSTCWMNFTLPTVVGLNLEAQIDKELERSTSALVIEKKVEGAVVTDRNFEFVLHLKNADDSMLYDDFAYNKYDAEGKLIPLVDGNGLILRDEALHSGSKFTLKDGERIIITNLPVGTKYEVEEVIPADKSRFPYQVDCNIITSDKDTNIKYDKHIEGNKAEGVISENLKDTVTITNKASPELPSTGGSGTTYLYAIGALLILLAGCLMYKRIQLLRKEGGAED